MLSAQTDLARTEGTEKLSPRQDASTRTQSRCNNATKGLLVLQFYPEEYPNVFDESEVLESYSRLPLPSSLVF